eukprot:scaffold5235_cov74-Skeletonema_dohrnii-CCMP3373.AAC.2
MIWVNLHRKVNDEFCTDPHCESTRAPIVPRASRTDYDDTCSDDCRELSRAIIFSLGISRALHLFQQIL